MSFLRLPAYSFVAFGVVALVLSFALASCCRHATSTAGTVKQAVLKVNGVAISELEVAMESRRGHGAEDTTDSREQVLEGLAVKEVMAQKAAALGLENDPGFQERMARVEAQRASQRRKELSRLYYKHEVLDRVTVSDMEARDLYDANQARIRTENHVAQILTRDEAEAARALKDLQDGKSFDEVAARGYPDLPAGTKSPWDLGFLKWKNTPPEWQSALTTLTPGQTSGIIKGPGRRFWIVKLVERRENPELTFEKTKADLIDELKGRRIQELSTRLEADLLRAAKVEKLPSLAPPSVPSGAGAPAPIVGHP
jgi:parvulin-like peptidyl-prolyl isomerase